MGQHMARPVEAKKSHVVRNVVIAILLLLVACAAVAGVFGYQLYKSAMAAKTHVYAVVDEAAKLKSGSAADILANLDGSIAKMQKEAKSAQQEVDKPIWNMASKLPIYGSDIASVRTTVGVLNDFANGTLPQLQRSADQLFNSNLSDGNGGLNVEPMITAAEGLNTTTKTMRAQLDTLNKLPEAHLGVINKALTEGKTQFNTLADKVDELTGIINMMPSFLGANGTRNYVLLAQTNSEIRSSGGLCGSAGSFTADHGKITVGEFHPDAEFHGSAVDQLHDDDAYVFSDLWFGQVIHNITSTPNFPQSARMASELWQQQSFGFQTDGVMSLDPVALQSMVADTQPVTMPDGRVLDGSNTASFLLNGVYKEVAVADQDKYFSSVAEQVVSNLFSDMNSQKLMKLASTLMKMGEQRHVYFWSFHDEDLAALRSAGVTGEISSDKTNPVTGLYLNEMAASKIDYYIDRKTVVTRTNGNTYHVTTTFTNRLQPGEVAALPEYIKANGKTGIASNDLMIYAPAGGSVANVETSAGTSFRRYSVDDHDVYKTSISIAPASTVTVTWDVTVADGAQPLKFDQTPTITDPNVTYQY